MPPWMLKAAVQGALSLAPSPHRLNEILQRYVTRSLRLTEPLLLDKWDKCKRHVGAFAAHSPDAGGPGTILEIGTGWYPVVPVALALATGARVITVDTSDLLSRDRVLETFDAFRQLAVRPDCSLPVAKLDDVVRIAREESAMRPREMLALAGIKALIGDARALPLASGTVDLVVSNNTLEHIPPADLTGMLRELRRVGSRRAVMSHHIDLADHYALFDPSIGVLNFLRYSSRVWPLFNNALQYQNRLRLSDYQRMHEHAGWRIVEEDGRRAGPAELAAISLAPEFRKYDVDDLRVYEAWIVSRPKGGDDDVLG